MEFNVLFFATIKLRTGVAKTSVVVNAEPPTVEALLNVVEQSYPKISTSMSTLLVAVNKEFASREQILKAGDEIALFPPVSGG